MIQNFLRPPQGVAEAGADLLRAFGAVSVVLAAVFFDPTDAGIVAFTLLGLVAPRFVGVRAWADITSTAVLLIAAWSNVFDLYATVPGWDLVVHFVCGGTLAAGLYLFLARLRIVAIPVASGFTFAAGIVLTTTFGLAL